MAELLDGETFECAARAAGVGPSTLYRWMAEAKAGDPRFGPMNDVVRQAKHAKELNAAFDWFLPKLLKAGF
jgi:transposase-like protein